MSEKRHDKKRVEIEFKNIIYVYHSIDLNDDPILCTDGYALLIEIYNATTNLRYIFVWEKAGGKYTNGTHFM